MSHARFATLAVFAAALAGPAQADTHTGEASADASGGGEVTVSHGYNEFGDLKYGPDFAHFDYVNPDAPIHGELSYSNVGTFDSMNALATRSGTPAALSTSMYETLMDTSLDEVGSYYCLLCETIEYPEDRSWVIFHLREGITFSDGTPLTAEDVVFTHELLREQATPSYRQGIVELVAAYEALDERTVKFTFEPDSPTKGRIGQMGAMLVMQKAWFEETGARLDESRLEISPGSGEYMVGSVDPGRRVTYVRNPDYWGEDLPIMEGRGNYESIRIEYFADSSAAFEAFTAGEYTFRQETSSIDWATGYDFPALQKGWVVKEEIPDGSLPAATGFVFNLRREKFQDPLVREALGLAYNFTWTNDTLQYGLFEQRTSFWENERLAATGVPEGRELEILESVSADLDPAILTEEAVMPHASGDRPMDRGNRRRALALFAEAGYEPGDDGLLRDAEGNTLEVEFLEARQAFDRIINPYVENLRAFGVDARYVRVDPAQYQARTQSNDFDMIYDFYLTGLQEGRGFLQRFGCEDKDDVFNPAGFCHPAVDEIGERIASAEDYDEMAALVTAADRIMRAERFIVPAWYNDAFWVAYYDMYEYPEVLPEFALGYLDHWWIDAEKEAALREAGAMRR